MSPLDFQPSGAKTCLIGAGSSGIAAAKALHERGIPSTASRSPTASAATGSSATRTGCRPPTGRCTSTRRASACSTRTTRCRSPIPTSPTTPRSPPTSTTTSTTSASASGSLRDRGRRTPRAGRRRWTVNARQRREASYDALVVANGHHWDPRWPEPAFPGDVRGREMHAHDYIDNELQRQARGRPGHGQQRDGHRRRVELRRRARHTSPPGAASRRPQVPVRPAARPDRRNRLHRCPPWCGPASAISRRCTRRRRPMETTGSRSPTTGSARPTPRSPGDILDRIAHGAITPKPNIAELRGRPGASSPTAAVEEADVDRLLHGLQGHVSVLRRGLHLRAGQRPAAVPPGLPPGDRRRSSSSGCCSRSARSCRSPRPRGNGSPTTCAASTRCPPGRAARRTSSASARDVRALRGLQAPHDAGRLRRLPARARARARAPARERARRPASALPVAGRGPRSRGRGA